MAPSTSPGVERAPLAGAVVEPSRTRRAISEASGVPFDGDPVAVGDRGHVQAPLQMGEVLVVLPETRLARRLSSKVRMISAASSTPGCEAAGVRTFAPGGRVVRWPQMPLRVRRLRRGVAAWLPGRHSPNRLFEPPATIRTVTISPIRCSRSRTAQAADRATCPPSGPDDGPGFSKRTSRVRPTVPRLKAWRCVSSSFCSRARRSAFTASRTWPRSPPPACRGAGCT